MNLNCSPVATSQRSSKKMNTYCISAAETGSLCGGVSLSPFICLRNTGEFEFDGVHLDLQIPCVCALLYDAARQPHLQAQLKSL